MSASIETIDLGGEGGEYALEAENAEEHADSEQLPVAFSSGGSMPDDDEGPRRRSRKRGRDSEYVTYDDPEDQATSQELICMLVRFGQHDRFASYLSSLGFKLTPTHLRQLDIELLQATKTRVIAACMNKGTGTYVAGVVYSCTQAAETIVAKSGLKDTLFLQGLTECLKKDESFNDMITLYELTSNISRGSPLLVALYSVLSNAGKVHSINKFLKIRAELARKQQAQEEIVGEDKQSNDHDATQQ